MDKEQQQQKRKLERKHRKNHNLLFLRNLTSKKWVEYSVSWKIILCHEGNTESSKKMAEQRTRKLCLHLANCLAECIWFNYEWVSEVAQSCPTLCDYNYIGTLFNYNFKYIGTLFHYSFNYIGTLKFVEDSISNRSHGWKTAVNINFIYNTAEFIHHSTISQWKAAVKVFLEELAQSLQEPRPAKRNVPSKRWASVLWSLIAASNHRNLKEKFVVIIVATPSIVLNPSSSGWIELEGN